VAVILNNYLIPNNVLNTFRWRMIPLTSCDAKSWEKAKVEVITETVGAECIFNWVILTNVNSLRDFFISCFNVQGDSHKKIYD